MIDEEELKKMKEKQDKSKLIFIETENGIEIKIVESEDE